eukprot:7387106-Prymnesium_polylepis.1
MCAAHSASVALAARAAAVSWCAWGSPWISAPCLVELTPDLRSVIGATFLPSALARSLSLATSACMGGGKEAWEAMRGLQEVGEATILFLLSLFAFCFFAWAARGRARPGPLMCPV